MSNKFDIPVIIQVSADNIEAARKIAYEIVEAVNEPIMDDGQRINAAMTGDIELIIANDEHTTRDKQRLFLLHPENTHAEYDHEAYNSALKDQDHEQE